MGILGCEGEGAGTVKANPDKGGPARLERMKSKVEEIKSQGTKK